MINGANKITGSPWIMVIVTLAIWLASFAFFYGSIVNKVEMNHDLVQASNEALLEVNKQLASVQTQLAVLSNTGSNKAVENTAQIAILKDKWSEINERLLNIEIKLGIR